MRSLIILEIEHGETTDGLDAFAGLTYDVVPEILANTGWDNIKTIDHKFMVDVPECFVLNG